MADDAAGISGRPRLTRLRTLGRGASGAVVSLFAAGDDELLAVKSAGAASAQALLRREEGILASLCSPYVLPCLGSRAAAGGGEYQLFLEFAPGGSLADEVERNGGRLEEGAIRAYAADVARGLAYLHGESMVHGDVKGRNVVIGADGWAKLADFGCARSVGSAGPFGGTPAFMAPEVARGEEQGPAADVWALGCTVIEMATGRAPWGGVDDVIAAVHLIGYTDAVPESPERLSSVAKDFLDKCLRRRAAERWTAVQLLEHPFLAFAGCGVGVEAKWVSPKSTLDAAMWESDADDDEEEPDYTADQRMKALAASCSVLPDWESDDGWIDALSRQSETPEEQSSIEESLAEETMSDEWCWDEEGFEEAEILEVEEAQVVGAAEAFDASPRVGGDDDIVLGVADNEVSAIEQQSDVYSGSVRGSVVLVCVDKLTGNNASFHLSLFFLCLSSFLLHAITNPNISFPNPMNSTRRQRWTVHRLNMAMHRSSRVSEQVKTTRASRPFPIAFRSIDNSQTKLNQNPSTPPEHTLRSSSSKQTAIGKRTRIPWRPPGNC